MTYDAIDCVFFDFGDTLAQEPFFVHPPAEVPNWTELIDAVVFGTSLFDRWAIGEVDSRTVAERLAAHCALGPAQVEDAMRRDCTALTWNPAVERFLDGLAGTTSTAVVTINPDIFSTVIAPHYRIPERVDGVVTSWEERTLDKLELCRIALERLGGERSLATCLLIDNKLSNVESFEAAGGQGFHFVSDAAFADAVPELERGIGR